MVIPYKQPQTNHNQRSSMLTRHCISYIYIQLTVYHNDHITITHPTHNSTGELLHPNDIKVALPVCLNQNCHAPSEYNGQKLLRVWSPITTLPSFKTRWSYMTMKITVNSAIEAFRAILQFFFCQNNLAWSMMRCLLGEPMLSVL